MLVVQPVRCHAPASAPTAATATSGRPPRRLGRSSHCRGRSGTNNISCSVPPINHAYTVLNARWPSTSRRSISNASLTSFSKFGSAATNSPPNTTSGGIASTRPRPAASAGSDHQRQGIRHVQRRRVAPGQGTGEEQQRHDQPASLTLELDVAPPRQNSRRQNDRGHTQREIEAPRRRAQKLVRNNACPERSYEYSNGKMRWQFSGNIHRKHRPCLFHASPWPYGYRQRRSLVVDRLFPDEIGG